MPSTTRSQWTLPDLNCKLAIVDGWEPKTPKREPKTPWEPDAPLWAPQTPSRELKTPFQGKKTPREPETPFRELDTPNPLWSLVSGNVWSDCGVGNFSNLGTGNSWSLASGNRCNLDNRDLRFAAGTSPLGTFTTFLLRAYAAVWVIFSGSPCNYSALGQRSFDENRWSLLLGTFKTFWNLVDEKLWGHVACGTFGTLQRQGWHHANRDCCNFGTGSFRNFSIGNLEPIAIRNL